MGDLKAKQREDMGAEEFAVPGKRKLPIHDASHIKLAWDMVDRTQGLTSEERVSARHRILAAAKKAGVDTGGWAQEEASDTVVGAVEIITDSAAPAGTPMIVRFRGTRANVVNENGRLYPDAVLADAVERATAYVQAGRMIGESPHPKAVQSASGRVVFDTNLENSVIKVLRLFKEGPEVLLDAEVLETAKGRDLKAILKQGGRPGISMRALGSSVQRQIGGRIVDVWTHLNMHAFDVVMNPATDGCEALCVLTDAVIERALEDGIQGEVPIRESPPPQAPARQEQTMTDTVTKETTSMDQLKDNPEFLALVAAKAKEVAQPALDAVEAQKAAEATATAKAQAKAEAQAFCAEKMATLKGKISDQALQVVSDAVAAADTKDMAQVLFDSAIKVMGAASAQAGLDALGFDPTKPTPQGHVRVEVGEGAKPWTPVVDAICKELDSLSEQFGNTIDPKLREHNRKHVLGKLSSDPSCTGISLMQRIEDSIVSRDASGSHVLSGPRALADSAKVITDAVQGGQVASDSIGITTSNLLNQPTIIAAILVQAFQDCEALQFLFTDIFRGSEWRQPVETFTSAQTWNPATFLQDLVVAEGAGITPSVVNLAWQSFSPAWRRNAVSLTTDVIRQLQTGPVNYGAIARAIYHITEDKRRKLDLLAYLEMILTSDEYQALQVTNETPASADKVTTTGLPAGTNAAYLYKLVPGTPGYAAPTIIGGVALGGNPILRPRTVNKINSDGTVTAVTSNALSVTVGGTQLVLGPWDGTNIQSFPGTTATCAFDFEHGILYLKSTSGVNPDAATPILPRVSYYAATNYDRWSYTPETGVEAAVHYDSLLQQLTRTAALMGSSPRFKKPNLALFSLNSATYVENARIFYKWASPDGTRLIDTGNTFGQRSGMNLSRINAPWVAGDGRILLTQKGSTRYGIETPYEMEGPHPLYDANQNVVDAKVWFGRENSVMATPVVKDPDGKQLNPPSRTIILQP